MKHCHTPKVHFYFYFKVRNSLITAEKFQKQNKTKKISPSTEENRALVSSDEMC